MSTSAVAGSPPSGELAPEQAKPRGEQETRGEEEVRLMRAAPTDQTPNGAEVLAEASCGAWVGARRVLVERPRSRLAKAFQIHHPCQPAMQAWTMLAGSWGSTRG